MSPRRLSSPRFVSGLLAQVCLLICLVLQQISGSLEQVRASAWLTFGADMLLEAAADCISTTACAESISPRHRKESLMKLVDLGMRSKKQAVQIAAARAFGAISRYVNCDSEVTR